MYTCFPVFTPRTQSHPIGNRTSKFPNHTLLISPRLSTPQSVVAGAQFVHRVADASLWNVAVVALLEIWFAHAFTLRPRTAQTRVAGHGCVTARS